MRPAHVPSYFLSILLFVLFVTLTFSGGWVRAEETDPAILELRQAIQENPDDPDRHFQLALLYVGKYEKKREAILLDAVITETRETIRLRPEHSEAHLLLYGALLQKIFENGDVDLLSELKRAEEQILRLNLPQAATEQLPPYQFAAGMAYLKKAEKENKKKLLDRALQELREAVRLRPDLLAAHVALAGIYAEQDQKDLALYELKEAARLTPDNPAIHEMLGSLYKDRVQSKENCYDEGAIREGIKEYKEVIRLNPDYAKAHSELGWLYCKIGLHDLEVYEAREALRLAENAENYHNLADALLCNGEIQEALKQCDKALELNPKAKPEIFYNLAWAYFLQNRLGESVAAYKSYFAGAKSPRLYPVLHQYLTLSQIGRHAEAHEFLAHQTQDFKGTEWERYLLQYHLGKLNESELISKTKDKCEQCEAFFYVGYQYLLRNDKEKAAEYFKKVLDTKVFGYYEYRGARARLEQFGKEKETSIKK